MGCRTYQGFVRNWLHEAVENLRECTRAHPRPSHRIRVPAHAPFPILTHRLQDGHPGLSTTMIVHEVFSADGDLGGAHGGHLFGLAVHVRTDGRPEGVDDVHAEAHEEDVEEILRVQGEDVRQAWMRFDEMQHRRDEAHFGRRRLLLLLLLGGAFAAAAGP